MIRTDVKLGGIFVFLSQIFRIFLLIFYENLVFYAILQIF